MNLDLIIKKIIPFNNVYRDNGKTPFQKLCALWNIGNELIKMGVEKPHQYGWQIQRETKGIIKRPTIFRGYKVRLIWPSLDNLKSALNGIKGLSSFIEMLPLIDPEQQSKYKVPEETKLQIFKHACSDTTQSFKKYINSVKEKYAAGRLTKKVDRFRHLSELNKYVIIFSNLYKLLDSILNNDLPIQRTDFREQMPQQMRQSLSNMCISLTTKVNYRYYRTPKAHILSTRDDYNMLFTYFKTILDVQGDAERARIRKLISSDYFANMSDMLSSIEDESKVSDYKMRKKMSLEI